MYEVAISPTYTCHFAVKILLLSLNEQLVRLYDCLGALVIDAVCIWDDGNLTLMRYHFAVQLHYNNGGDDSSLTFVHWMYGMDVGLAPDE